MSKYLSKSFLSQSFNIPDPTLTERNVPAQHGRVFVVTGGYAGVGKELSKILYAKGATVYVAGRNEAKGNEAIESIKQSCSSSSGRLEFLMLDLNDLSTIKQSAETFLSKEERLDVLVNNAGVMFPPAGTKTKQGHDMQFGTNCLGPFLFTKLLLPIISKTAQNAPASSVRVLWAGSSGIQVLSPDQGVVFQADGQPKIYGSQQTNYGQTKVGNLLLAVALQKQLEKDGVISVSFNPGNLSTELQRHSGGLANRLASSMLHPAIFGAYTELWAATSPEVTLAKKITYVIPWGRDGTSLIRKDITSAIASGIDQRFWTWCEKETSQFS